MAAADTWAGAPGGITGPLVGVVAATKHDTNEETTEARALYVGTAGDVSILTHNGQSVVLAALAAGVWHPIRVRRVNSTGTVPAVVLLGY